MSTESIESPRKLKSENLTLSKEKNDKKKRKLNHDHDDTPAQARLLSPSINPAPSWDVNTTTALSPDKDFLRLVSPPPCRNPPELSHLPASSPYFLTTASIYLSISPAYSRTPTLGIKRDHLDPLDMKYSTPLNGVVLFHKNVSFQKRTVKVMYESPFAMAWVDVEFVVWRPEVGMVLEGWVNDVGPGHVGLLCANMFSVSVSTTTGDEDKERRIPGDWRWEEGDVDNGGYWVDGQGQAVEGLMRFVVVGTRNEGGMLSIEGSFVPLRKGDDVVMVGTEEEQLVAGRSETERTDGPVQDNEVRSKAEKAKKKAEKEKKRKEKEARKEKAT